MSKNQSYIRFDGLYDVVSCKKIKRIIKKFEKLKVYPDGDGDSVVSYYDVCKIVDKLKEACK